MEMGFALSSPDACPSDIIIPLLALFSFFWTAVARRDFDGVSGSRLALDAISQSPPRDATQNFPVELNVRLSTREAARVIGDPLQRRERTAGISRIGRVANSPSDNERRRALTRSSRPSLPVVSVRFLSARYPFHKAIDESAD